MSREIVEVREQEYIKLIEGDESKLVNGDYSDYVVYFFDDRGGLRGIIPKTSELEEIIGNGAYVFKTVAATLGFLNSRSEST